jgi:hypothetical protein
MLETKTERTTRQNCYAMRTSRNFLIYRSQKYERFLQKQLHVLVFGEKDCHKLLVMMKDEMDGTYSMHKYKFKTPGWKFSK